MAWTVWDAADGQLSSTPATTLVTASNNSILGEILLTNTHTAAVTTNLYANRAGSDRRIGGKDFTIPAGGYRKISVAVALKSGDIVKGDASVDVVVDYVLSGVEDA